MFTWQSFIKSKFASWVLALVLLIVVFLAGRMYLEKREVDKEIAKLQAKADEIRKENEDLSGLIKYWNTPEFQEKEAREKLNLKKEGEFVVVLPDDESENRANSDPDQQKSNLSKWFDYFFTN